MKPQSFAMYTGALVGGTGLLGMIAPLRQPMVKMKDQKILNRGYGKIAGAIPTNHFFNFLRLGIGMTGILASKKRESSVIFNRAVAGSYAGMAILGVIPKTKTMFGLMPIFGGNVWLHGGTAAAELLAEEELMRKAKNILPKNFSPRNLLPFKKSKASIPALGARSMNARSKVRGKAGMKSLNSVSSLNR